MVASMVDFLEKMAGYGNRPALALGKEEISYRALVLEIECYSQQLSEMGVGNNDNVGLMLGNGPEFVYCLFAIWRLGATAVPVNTLYRQSELGYIIRHSGMKAVIGTSLLGEVLPGLGNGRAFAGTVIYRTDAITSPCKIPESDVAIIIYTSGTTSKPKGVMLTFANLMFTVLSWLEAVNQNGDDVVLLALPLFHIFGLTLTLLATLEVGGLGILLPGFDAEEAATLIEEHKVTIFCGVPAMFIRLLNAPQARTSQLATLRFCVSGGSPLAGTIVYGGSPQNRYRKGGEK